MKRIFGLVLASTVLLATPSANAALLDFTIDFTASDFATSGGPYSSVTGSFTFSFDDSTNISNSSTGLTVNSLSPGFGPDPIVFSYSANDKRIYIAEFPYSNAAGCLIFNGGFCAKIKLTANGPKLNLFEYQSSGTLYVAGNKESSFTTPAVPEPASWALMIGGLGLAGAALRTRKSSMRVART